MRKPGIPCHALLTALTLAGCLSVQAVDRITVVALFKGKALVEVDGKRHLMREGGKAVDGIRLVKATAHGADLEVNGVVGEYKLGRRISATFRAPDATRPLRIFPQGDGIYRADGAINGRGVRFAVDTGATLIAMNRNEARRLGLDYLRDGVESSAQTAGGPVRTYELNLDTVRIGHIELRNVTGSVVDGDYPDEILLGNSFLSRVRMRREGAVMELSGRGY